nr:LysE family translocator [Methanomassiliicoccales archaeon]
MSIETALLFLGSVAVISLSGVLMPGPVFAVTIACGYNDRRAGWKIALGHILVEVPLIVGIFFGLSTFLRNDSIFALIGLLGGGLLIYMGWDMVRKRKEIVTSCDTRYKDPFIAGIMTTVSNPGWLLWWATVGAALITTAITFGLWMLPLFVIVHITCDLIWEGLIALTVFDTKGKWDNRWHQYMIAGSGALMIVFAIIFIVNGVNILL